jgi:PKD repeat protein
VGGDELSEGAPGFSIREFRRLPLPAGKVNIEPDGRPVLINIETNVYVDAEPVVLRTRVVGVDVEVLATPSSFTWTFGDGGRLVTTDHGAPYPNMSTTHVYTQPGRWPVTLTTTYTGHYRLADIPNSPRIPIIGTAAVTSPSVTLDVIEARAVLVP